MRVYLELYEKMVVILGVFCRLEFLIMFKIFWVIWLELFMFMEDCFFWEVDRICVIGGWGGYKVVEL